MIDIRHNSIILILATIMLTSCKQENKIEVRNDFNKYYTQFNVEGTFVLYDQNADKYLVFNPSLINEPFIPASTFKICNSLIGLETGVIKDENFLIHWDSIKRNPDWDKDHTLKTAFQVSAVWYYQELARRVGGQKMKNWLDKTNYGNTDTSGGIDKFWLTGGLRISPQQQIDFLRRLHDNKLPFSQRSVDIVKEIMIAKDSAGYILRAKTGWSRQSGKEIGWYIGYVETKNDVFYFANCVQVPSQNMAQADLENKFVASRKTIALSIMKELKIIDTN